MFIEDILGRRDHQDVGEVVAEAEDEERHHVAVFPLLGHVLEQENRWRKTRGRGQRSNQVLEEDRGH